MDKPYPFPDIESFSFDSLNIRGIYGGVEKFIKTESHKNCWKEWLGTLLWEELVSDNKLVLITFGDDDESEILNSTNQQLVNKLYNVFRVLPLVTTLSGPRHEPISITGRVEIEDDERFKIKDIREISRYRSWPDSFYWREKEFLDLRRSYETNSKLIENWDFISTYCSDKIFKLGSKLQLIESYRSFEAAFFSTPKLEFKIPNLVRSVESIIGLPRGQGKAEFYKRVQYLCGVPEISEPYGIHEHYKNLLENLFQIRSDCVHGKPFAWSLRKELGESFSDTTVAQYEFLSEWIARRTLLNVRENQNLLNACESRDQLETYWDTIQR
ncbi:MAG: hypothetical protein CL678_15085 [Bdellovibrionaceae bacterium]|nr:hypothetical protein [Pseudobdellovibrionaceae bacterium]